MITIAPTRFETKAVQLSDEEVQEGLRILRLHSTVADMAGQHYLIDDIVDEVFVHRFAHEEFGRYAWKFSGYDVAAQKAFVKGLLSMICKS